jgi:hypothetical protein
VPKTYSCSWMILFRKIFHSRRGGEMWKSALVVPAVFALTPEGYVEKASRRPAVANSRK